MLAEAYQELHALEDHHWWYVGARSVYKELLKIGLGKPVGDKRMLEIGCGSGANLRLIEEYGPTLGVDLSLEALKMIPNRPTLGLIQADATALPFLGSTFDGVNLLGVVEHIDDDGLAIQESRRVCCRYGSVVLLTSALWFLWSHHDESNQHKRRYTKVELKKLMVRSGLIPLKLSYQNFFTFLPTLFVRLWQKQSTRKVHYDMGRPPKWLNLLLIQILRLEAWLIARISLPIGVDLVAVCKPE